MIGPRRSGCLFASGCKVASLLQRSWTHDLHSLLVAPSDWTRPMRTVAKRESPSSPAMGRNTPKSSRTPLQGLLPPRRREQRRASLQLLDPTPVTVSAITNIHLPSSHHHLAFIRSTTKPTRSDKKTCRELACTRRQTPLTNLGPVSPHTHTLVLDAHGISLIVGAPY
jgi:hypothetical protein